MIARFYIFLACWFGSFSVALAASAPTPLPPLPSAELIVSNLLARAVWIANNKTPYEYDRKVVINELDSKGVTKSKQEKEYTVTMIAGIPHFRLLKVDGTKLPDSQLRAEEERERQWEKKMEDSQGPRKPGEGFGYVSADVAERFVYEVKRVEIMEGRPAWVVTFKPRSDNLPVKRLTDRLVNKLRGTFWVDTQDFEIVRLDTNLAERITLWGGIAGTMDVFDLTLQRSRGEDGFWFNRYAAVHLEGRKFLSAMRFKATEEGATLRRAKSSTNSSQAQLPPAK